MFWFRRCVRGGWPETGARPEHARPEEGVGGRGMGRGWRGVRWCGAVSRARRTARARRLPLGGMSLVRRDVRVMPSFPRPPRAMCASCRHSRGSGNPRAPSAPEGGVHTASGGRGGTGSAPIGPAPSTAIPGARPDRRMKRPCRWSGPWATFVPEHATLLLYPPQVSTPARLS